MFGLGLSEIITFVIVIIVFTNPKDLPTIVRKIGVIYAKIMKQINGIKRTFSEFEQEVQSFSEIKPSGKSLSGRDEEKHNIEGEIK